MITKTVNWYEDLQLDKYFWGGALTASYDRINLSITSEVINTLDEVCKSEKLNPLGEKWHEIDVNQFEHLLKSALQFDLGFTEHRVMPIEKAEDFFKILTDSSNTNASKYFTNCYNHFWDNQNKGYAANSISSQTMDLVTAKVSADKTVLVYFLFED